MSLVIEINNMPEPKKVFENFCAIASIPRGSGNTKEISDYCVKCAEKYNLRYVQDEAYNVVVYVDASEGYEKAAPVIIQGHLDMVCDKTDECRKDMSREGVDILIEGEYIRADGTTLGGDDGAAVAYMLTLMEDRAIEHPPLELLFTSDEEVGMLGARALDGGLLHTNMLINIDSETEGILTTSCAGGVRAVCSIPISREKAYGRCYNICISGLRGGHSGIEINTGRVNANKLLGRMLNFISQSVDFKIAKIEGGKKYNAIPGDAEAEICIDEKPDAVFNNTVKKFIAMIKQEKAVSEPNLSVSVKPVSLPEVCFDTRSTKRMLFALLQIPDGVQSMSPDIADLVQTSLNLGIVETGESRVLMYHLLRSNAASGKQAILQKLKSFAEYLDGTVEFTSDYPAWEYRVSSKLRSVMVDSYTELYGEPPALTAIHAGLECGILAGKIEDIDAVSFGPNILHAHTPQEKMEIASVGRCWEYLKKVIKNLK